MTDPKKLEPTIVPAERFAADVSALLDFARQRGREGREVRTKSRKQRVITTGLRDKPDISDALEAELRDALESSIVPAVEAEDSDLFEIEKQREIQKKALMILSRRSLARLAESMKLDKRGTAEELAERLARALKHDEQKIAQLIIENAEEPEPDRRFSARLFPLERTLDLSHVSDRIGWALGRYIRIGVARWVVFEEVLRDEDELTLGAQLFSYSAQVDTQDHDPSLAATPSTSSIKLRLFEGHSVVHVDQAGINESRGALKALESVTDIRRLGRLPATPKGLEGALGTFDPVTVLMLDLIYNRASQAQARSINLTAAKFRMDKEEAHIVAADNPEKPTLRSVRFEGRHLLDSPAACRLIAKEARALVDISMTVGVEVSGGSEEMRFPVRFILSSDHAAVMTGYGLIPRFARLLNERLIEGVEVAIEQGITSRDRLEDLAERILAFSASDEAADRPAMLQ
jgi:hypothetical protein